MGACRTSIGAAVHLAWRYINRRRCQNALRRPRGALDPIAGVGVSNPRCCDGARDLHTIGNEPFAAYAFLPVIPMQESREQPIKRYLQSGEYDTNFGAWPGDSYLGRVQQGDAALRKALRSAIQERITCGTCPVSLVELDVASVTRRKVLPMVQGLFPRHEQACVLDMLERSVVFLTPVTIDQYVLAVEGMPRIRLDAKDRRQPFEHEILGRARDGRPVGDVLVFERLARPVAENELRELSRGCLARAGAVEEAQGESVRHLAHQFPCRDLDLDAATRCVGTDRSKA